jgi:hypothetical protein
VRSALERGGPRSRAKRTSSEAEPARGKRTPSIGAEPARGRRAPSSEASLLEGIFKWATLVGRWGHRGAGHALHA